MSAGGLGGSGVGLSDVLTTLKNGVIALNSVASALKAIFPQSGQTSTSATGGSAVELPGEPAAYLTVTINGTPYKIPLFNP